MRPEILAMEGYVPGEQPRDWNVIKLNTNENPYPPSPAVAEAVEAVLRRGLQRYPDPLATEFREKAGELLGFPPDWILCGNGSDDILTIITRTFVASGGVIRFAYPGYLLYATLAEIQGAEIERVFFRPDWSLGADFGRPSARLRLVFLANPNSPSGTVIPPAEIATWACQLRCPIIVDEAYADFADSNCLDLVRQFDNVLVVRSLSKSYALAGLRFGFVVAQPHLINQMRKVKDSYNCDALAIAGATAAISDRRWFDETRAKILATRAILTQRMRHLGFDVPPSQANFTWNVHPELPARIVYERLKQRGILVRYMNFPGWGDGLRISVGTDEQIKQCVDSIEQIIREGV
ncbi:MAG: histidinol-phosphate transaminase [Thermoguttaceae bacterium]|nr:histidinol-phosphate transaminase [Thermoguttaceae bacterium]MDW8077358.1 histidinol-phosphate transaminase [Thermoguttaceae bacterium]